MPNKIDITPVGCFTPEGLARVQMATIVLVEANARCADALRDLLEDRANGDFMSSSWEEAALSHRARVEANEAFLKALAGQ